ncbi:MAG: hypothetical protein QOD05_1483 [Microbacteriaceae bacterium]|jgi:hypothetical protein|nr:hypothetical protein [Microbacteriaceae bacterium]
MDPESLDVLLDTALAFEMGDTRLTLGTADRAEHEMRNRPLMRTPSASVGQLHEWCAAG